LFSYSPPYKPKRCPSQQKSQKVIAKFSPGYGCRCLLKIYLRGKPLQNNNSRKEQFKEFGKKQFKVFLTNELTDKFLCIE